MEDVQSPLSDDCSARTQQRFSNTFEEYLVLHQEGVTPQLKPSHRAIFIPFICLVCAAALLLEFFTNGAVQEPNSKATAECYYRLTVAGHTICAAQLSMNPLIGPSNEALIQMGAKRKRTILEDGEAWRLVAPLFLHAGFFHFLLNMVVLLQLGLRLEELHGPLRVGALYMASGIYGVIMSTALSPRSISVGASGAIMGLLGASLGEVLLHWQIIKHPCFALAELGGSAVLQLLLGTTPRFDNFQHFFGFLMGLVFALGILTTPSNAMQPDQTLATKLPKQMLQVVAALVACLIFVTGLLALHGEWDPYEICPWCNKISCIPFPWGCDQQSKDGGCWWDCSTCSGRRLYARYNWRGWKGNGTVQLRCPELRGGHNAAFENVTIEHVDVSAMSGPTIVHLCKQHCPDAWL